MSEEQQQLIRLTWKPLNEDLTSVGKQVFLKIFEMQPSVKQMFPFRHVWGDSLIRHPQFQAHVNRFMLTVAEAVANMANINAFGESLYVLGQGHTQHRGFSAGYFDAFLSSMMFVWQQELKMNSETKEAWGTLLQFIMNKLKEGYTDQLKAIIHSQKHTLTTLADEPQQHCNQHCHT